ncbi:MAG: hypothetical protein AAGI17_01015 [Planctomycetota bacterium]
MKLGREMLILAAVAGSASAQVSDVLYSITATNGDGTASFSISQSELEAIGGTEGVISTDGLNWSLNGPLELRSTDGTLIATLESASSFASLSGANPDTTLGGGLGGSAGGSGSTFGTDPAVNVSFSVLAGASDTVFTISSSELTFTPLTNVVGMATAAITLTDTLGDGATITGLVDSGNIGTGPNGRDIAGSPSGVTHQYGAFVDGSAADNVITPFGFLLDSPFSVVGFGSDTISEDDPGAGFRPVGLDPVSSISSQFSFTLSANDTASGTSRFVIAGQIVPAPATFSALAGMGILASRRRRR